MSNYQRIRDYLDFLSQTYNLHICVKDFIGFIPINKNLDSVLSPYLAHTNPYCMFIKQDRNRYFKCLSMIRPMYNKCLADDGGFYGMCHAGVYEYVIPVRLNDDLLGSINVGCFPGKNKTAHFLVKRLFRDSDMSLQKKAIEMFDRHILPTSIQFERFIPEMLLLAEYLGQTYVNFQSSHVSRSIAALPRESLEDIIVPHAIEYINQNYQSKISVKQIANFCHCCESYINHTFGRRTGVNISTYINKVRIEHAKHHLLTAPDSITAIALNVGYSDSNYFSRVFTGLVGITPSEFRRRYTT